MICKLALEDGTVFTGQAFGAVGTRTGEVVFNTAMTGYQEVITDPSYCGQIVVMTFPLIGNYGVNDEDIESDRLHLSGLVVKELARRPSNHRATGDLAGVLAERGVMGIRGIDTRALTRRIRVQGAVRGALSTELHDDIELVRRARAAEAMVGSNLVVRVTARESRVWNAGAARASAPAGRRGHIVAIDCGIKHNILRRLAEHGDRVTVAPAGATAAQIQALEPDALLVGNGPGDPAAVEDTIAALKALIGQLPIMGICLGHQVLALAAGARTYKLKFGHHGANVPVLNKPAGRVEITSQNHGFAVEAASLEACGGVATHINLNDGSLEGFALPGRNCVAVQFHPEASPGPHDAGHIISAFVAAVRDGREIDEQVFADRTATG